MKPYDYRYLSNWKYTLPKEDKQEALVLQYMIVVLLLIMAYVLVFGV
jgi:hypothetical protein